MELPKMFKNWIDFATHCENKFPNAETIKVDEENTISVFPIEKIKANAFDEIRKRRFKKDSVLELRRILIEHRTPYLNQCDAKIIIDMLFSLSDID
jgi:hypothetical protein